MVYKTLFVPTTTVLMLGYTRIRAPTLEPLFCTCTPHTTQPHVAACHIRVRTPALVPLSCACTPCTAQPYVVPTPHLTPRDICSSFLGKLWKKTPWMMDGRRLSTAEHNRVGEVSHLISLSGRRRSGSEGRGHHNKNQDMLLGWSRGPGRGI